MKKARIFIFVIAAIIINSCSRPECPEPDGNSTSVVTAPIFPSQKIIPPGTAISLPNDAASVKDAYVSNANGGNGNTGPKTFFNARAWTISSVPVLYRSFLDFDYSSIPLNAEILKATLSLYADTTFVELEAMPEGHSTLSGSNAFYLKRITKSWDENTITWNTAPSTDNINQILLSASTSASQAYEIDVTTMIKDELKNPEAYHGFMLQLQTETPWRAITFYSSDNPLVDLRPKMEIKYR